MDRTSAEWAALVRDGNSARLRFIATGDSGLVTPEIRAQRMQRKHVRLLKKKHQGVSPLLMDKLVEQYRVRSLRLIRARDQREADEKAIRELREDEGVKELLRTGAPSIFELWDHLEVVSKDPVILQWTEVPKGSSAGDIPPNQVIDPLNQNPSSCEESAGNWNGRSVVVGGRDEPVPLVDPPALLWCETSGRCVCGPNVFYAWGHGNLTRIWNKHLPLKELRRGRTVIEVSSLQGNEVSGDPLLYLVSKKLKEVVALWQAEVLERANDGGLQIKARLLHKPDGSPEMVSRYDVIFDFLGRDKDLSASFTRVMRAVLPSSLMRHISGPMRALSREELGTLVPRRGLRGRDATKTPIQAA